MMIKTLIKKEIFELFKTRKFLILPILFLFFAYLSPLMAYFTPKILKLLEVPGLDLDSLPPPTQINSFSELLNNYNQIGYFVLIFIATGMFIGDKTKGRLILLISKPLKRSDIIISKYIVMIGQFIVAIIIGSIFFIPLTYYLFDAFDFTMYIQLLLLFILYGVFLITLALFNSILFKSYMASVLITITTFLSFGIVSLFNFKLFYILPGKITSLETQLLTNTLEVTETFWDVISSNVFISVVSTLAITILLFILSLRVFRNQEID